MRKKISAAVLLLFLLLILIGYLAAKMRFGNLNAKLDNNTSMISIMGEEIRVREAGEGQDIVLIHGTPGSIEDMCPLFDSLAQHHHVIAYDRPGHGYSSDYNIKRNLEHNTLLAAALIDHYQLDSTIVIGHSYGGVIAANLAIKGHERVHKMCALGSPLFTINCETIYKLFRIPVIGHSLSWWVSGWYSNKKIRAELPLRFGPNTHIADEEFVDYRSTLWQQPKVIMSKSLETAYLEQEVNDIQKSYNAFKHDFLIITGENDVPYYVTDLEDHLPLPRWESIIYPNTGHFVQLEQLDQLLADLDDYMQN